MPVEETKSAPPPATAPSKPAKADKKAKKAKAAAATENAYPLEVRH